MTPAEQEAYNEFLNKSLKDRDYFISATEKGREEGMEKGKREEKIEIARKMLRGKEPMEKIMEWTGLSKIEVEELLP